MIAETKIVDSFPVGHFLIEGFCTPHRLDRNSKGGGILLHDREDIPSNLNYSRCKSSREPLC